MFLFSILSAICKDDTTNAGQILVYLDEKIFLLVLKNTHGVNYQKNKKYSIKCCGHSFGRECSQSRSQSFARRPVVVEVVVTVDVELVVVAAQHRRS